ncbi:MAG: host attachment family protein [Novosphingobium sp.]
MKIANGTMLLIADGTRMLLLRNQGDVVYPDLKVVEHRATDNPPNRELLSDSPGVSFASGHQGRDTHKAPDPHQENEDRFAAEAAAALSAIARHNEAGLIVVAPPTTLGVLRKHYGPHVKERLIAEIAKDLVNHPVAEITRLVTGYDA